MTSCARVTLSGSCNAEQIWPSGTSRFLFLNSYEPGDRLTCVIGRIGALAKAKATSLRSLQVRLLLRRRLVSLAQTTVLPGMAAVSGRNGSWTPASAALLTSSAVAGA